ncbi:methyltransferase domain-containing protein [Streptomyces sp. URMC 123]|uniref:methyltransferase domain-containing protein n=1 Tax=Streptomyces sp. URMC 123 TaxID=3423403 RepID=UPI003F19BD3D
MTDADWTEAAKALADKVTVEAPEWHDAVSNTPRHLLIPRWWERVPNSPAEEWELIAPTSGSPAHLKAAFSDKTLITRVGPLHADHAQPDERGTGSPTSSSTLPGLVVSMLHRLHLKPGQAYLDVGFGSGYSAALAGRRLGDENVTSVDVDSYLVKAGRSRLAEFGRTPHVEAIDATGPIPGGDYDGIMATVGVRPVPETWLRALRPGGRLVTTIANTALLVTAEMGEDGVARGNVEPDSATFMETRQGADYPPRLDTVFAAAREAEGDDVRATDGPIPHLWQEWALTWLFELDTPGTETRAAADDKGGRIVWLLSADGSWARAEGDKTGTVHQSGRRRLWDDLERVRRKWEERNRFPLHHMSVTLSPDGNTLTAPGGGWSFFI